MTERLDALKELLGLLDSGVIYETMGHTIRCQKAFPKPDGFDGTREAYAKAAAQMAILSWRNGSLDAAKALHDAVLADGYVGDGFKYALYGNGRVSVWNVITDESATGEVKQRGLHSTCLARAWLIAIIKVLITQEEAKCS